jgi:hypothetical protein
MADFAVAFAPWNTGANGSILCVKPKLVASHFPISEEKNTVEKILGDFCYRINGQHKITTRVELDYKGDGFYTNNWEDIKNAVDKLTNNAEG